MNRFLLAFFAILFSTLLGVFSTVSSASAATPYDDAIETSDNFNISCNNSSVNSINLYNWHLIIRGDITEVDGMPVSVHPSYSSYVSQALSDLEDRMDDGIGWGVAVQGYVQSGSDFTNQLQIYIGSDSLQAPYFHTQTNDTMPGTTNYLAWKYTGGGFSNPQGRILSINCSNDNITIAGYSDFSPNMVAGRLNSWGGTTYFSKPVFLNFNITYPEGYEGEVPPELPEVPVEPPIDNSNPNQCSAWDVICWFQNVVGNVVDGFQTLGDLIANGFQAIGDFIANIIMPKNEDGEFTNIITDAFNTINNGFRERLGFLLFPFDFAADLFNGILESYNPTGSDWTHCPPGIGLTIPDVLGDSDLTLDICTLEDVMPQLYQIMVGIIRVVWVVGIVSFLHSKYFQIVKGDNI